ncbi:MAG: hypothetical protein AB7O62_07245 [Pirellulales bacterium]
MPRMSRVVPEEDLPGALRCVVYDLLILKWSIEDVEKPNEPIYGIPFGREEVSLVGGLIVCRRLVEFLTRETPARDTDICIRDFLIEPNPPTIPKTFIGALDKFAGHLTLIRAKKSERFPRPTHDDFCCHGCEVLLKGIEFVEEARKTVCLRGNGLRYYKELCRTH